MTSIDTGATICAANNTQRQRSGIFGTKQLSEEEQKRVDQLKEMLTDLLAEAQGQPDENQRGRIREIEKEIAKITGEKPRKSLAASTKKLPLKEKQNDEERLFAAILPEEVGEKTLPFSPEASGPGTLAMPLEQAAASFLAVADLTPQNVVEQINGNVDPMNGNTPDRKKSLLAALSQADGTNMSTGKKRIDLRV